MIFFKNPYTNPYFNLAAEEAMLNLFPEGFVILYRNIDTVVLGKHQNALAEVNFEYVYKNKIKIARRISGGGTVFHDHGNLNFTIAMPVKGQKNIIDFKRFLAPVIAFLKTLGVDAEYSGRNDILAGEYKISGNAEHYFRKDNVVLHHGTLLFDSDLSSLGNAIKPLSKKYTDKAVQSTRSKVTNVKELLNQAVTMEQFENMLADYLVNYFKIKEVRDFTCEETDKIEALAVTKFEKDEWNYGYSPAYQFNNSFEFNNKKGTIHLSVERESLIREAKIEHEDKEIFSQIEKYLINSNHFPNSVDTIIKKVLKDDSPKLNELTFSFF